MQLVVETKNILFSIRTLLDLAYILPIDESQKKMKRIPPIRERELYEKVAKAQ